MLHLLSLTVGWLALAKAFATWKNLPLRICNGSTTEISQIRTAKLLTLRCGSSGFWTYLAQCLGVPRSPWSMLMKACYTWMHSCGCAIHMRIGFFLVPFSSRMGVSTSWNSCLPLRLWLSTGSTAIGVCLATRQSAIIQPTGMKNFGMPFAKASVGLGTLQHLPHQWWKILLGFAPECQEVHMPVVFQLVPLGSIWFTPCKCGNEKKRVGVGWSWVANPSNVQLTYSGDTYVVESCGIHNLWKFLWTTIFDRTNYCWISRLPNKK